MSGGVVSYVRTDGKGDYPAVYRDGVLYLLIKERGIWVVMKGWRLVHMTWTKKDYALKEAERIRFNKELKPAHLMDMAATREAELRRAGVDDAGLARMQRGKPPDGYQLHHILPLDDGGTNTPSNYILVRNTDEHRALTGYQVSVTYALNPGESLEIRFPLPDREYLIYPPIAGTEDAATFESLYP